MALARLGHAHRQGEALWGEKKGQIPGKRLICGCRGLGSTLAGSKVSSLPACSDLALVTNSVIFQWMR